MSNKIYYQGITIHALIGCHTSQYIKAICKALPNTNLIGDEVKSLTQYPLSENIENDISYALSNVRSVENSGSIVNLLTDPMKDISLEVIQNHTDIPKEYQEPSISIVNVNGLRLLKINMPFYADSTTQENPEEHLSEITTMAMLLVKGIMRHGDIVNIKSLYLPPGETFNLKYAESIYHSLSNSL